MKSEHWPIDRRIELEHLQSLLAELHAVNRGSNALKHITNAIELAEHLTKEDLTTPRKSFLSFLEEKATGR